MKVLLIRAKPTKIKNTRLPISLAKEVGYVPPLGLAYIAAYLISKGISVGILDAEAKNLSLEQVRQEILINKPKLVGITSMTPTIHNDFDIARVSKESGALVVMGGPHFTAMPMETLKNKHIDFGILGEGEYPMFKLVEAIDKKIPFNEVPGLGYKDKNNNCFQNQSYIHPNIDELPIPARELLPNELYHSIISKGRLTTVCAGRGCPFPCGFCFKQPSDNSIRYKTPKLVVDEIEEVVKKYNVKEINFISDTLTIKKNFIKQLCNEIINRKINISWIAPTRADCITPELVKLMKKSGCRSLRYGVESGSEKMLKLMGKKLEKRNIIDAFRWTKEAKIEAFAYLILGYLNETEETIKETLHFVKELKPDLLMYNVAVPLPKTMLFQQAVDAGLIDPNYWDNFLMDENYEKVPYLFKDTEKWIGKAYRDFFYSPRFVTKKLLEMRPNNILNYIKGIRGLLGLK